jgi:hypothetical protein
VVRILRTSEVQSQSFSHKLMFKTKIHRDSVAAGLLEEQKSLTRERHEGKTTGRVLCEKVVQATDTNQRVARYLLELCIY